MPKRRKSSSMEKCRICLRDNGLMTDIFTPELRGMIKELADSTSINIDENDSYPRNICHVCLYKLDMWCDFKAQFLRCNGILMQHLDNTELSDHAVSPAKRKISESPSSVEPNYDRLAEMQEPSDEFAIPIKLEEVLEKIPIPSEPSENLHDPLDPLVTPPGMLDSTSETRTQQNQTPDLKPRSSLGRRTSEQRLASTQRWEARKKALLAATGENDSDSDSIASDDNQLSPIQKARAKNNAEKEAEKQRRLSKVCNNFSRGGILESSATDSYLQKSPENNVQMELLDQNDDFIPQSVQSEIIVGDATYVVTSTLLLTEPSINQSHQTKEKISEDLPNYQNTDIMDAVKLKRVVPPSKSSQKDNNFIERCGNFEVEGTELPALQKVQTELAKFIEIDVKQKLTNNSPPVEVKTEPEPQDSGQTLEKLKLMIEKAIKDNIENSKMKRVPISKITMSDRVKKTFSSAFIKAAMKSPVFQPKVVLSRVPSPKIEVQNITESTRIAEVNHCNSTAVHVDRAKPLMAPLRKTYSIKSSHTPNILKSSRFDSAGKEKLDNSTKQANDTEKHMCVYCSAIFSSKPEVEAHSKLHKSRTVAEVKHKMMRCKRCHEIVEAKFVKTHVCKMSKYQCGICNKVFKIQSWLERHLRDQHKDVGRQVKIEMKSVEQMEVEPPVSLSQPTPTPSNPVPPVVNLEEIPQKVYSCFICDKIFENDDILHDHLQQHNEGMSEGEQVQEEKVYQCAICGEALDSESGLQNHVEKHLIGDGDDNPNLVNIEGLLQLQNNKQLHTCVQCAKQFDTELNLVMHMQQHEEDAAVAEWGKQGLKMQNDHACTICEERFDTEETLAHHLDLHNGSGFVCELCDRPFWTMDQLQEHVVSHCT